MHSLEKTLRDHDKLLGQYYHMKSIDEIKRQRGSQNEVIVSNPPHEPTHYERSLGRPTQESKGRSASNPMAYKSKYAHKRALSSSDPSSSSQVLQEPAHQYGAAEHQLQPPQGRMPFERQRYSVAESKSGSERDTRRDAETRNATDYHQLTVA